MGEQHTRTTGGQERRTTHGVPEVAFSGIGPMPMRPSGGSSAGGGPSFRGTMGASQGNLVLGIIAGAVAALVASILWAGITVVTEYQLSIMAIGVGMLVGAAVRTLGRGQMPEFGIAGAALSLVGCVFGNLLSACGFIARDTEMEFGDALSYVLGNPGVAVDAMRAMFHPMDILFYGLALYMGYRFSIADPRRRKGAEKRDPVGPPRFRM